MSSTGSFIEQLRWWQKRQGLSQLALANLAEISQRHLSFWRLVAPSQAEKWSCGSLRHWSCCSADKTRY